MNGCSPFSILHTFPFNGWQSCKFLLSDTLSNNHRFKLIPAHIYLFVVVLSWGIIASIQSITSNFAQLLILRGILGVSEAAFCGVPFYLSFFFRREELAFRTGLFISAAPLANTFASSIAWAITAIADKTPIASWRLLFLVEGFPSVVVAWYCYNNIADRPGSAWFLTRRERKLAVKRLEENGFQDDQAATDQKGGSKSVNFGEVWETLKDPKCYLTAAMFFSCNVAFSSLPVFLPTILQE
jgi:MFS family permease